MNLLDSAFDPSYTHPTASRSTSSSTSTSTSSAASDTLSIEFNELAISSFRLDQQGYNLKLDFAKKLGYTESQVLIAMQKLGPEPSQNELLSELILLDAGANSISGCGGGGGGGSEEEMIKEENREMLRHVIVDGSNVAMTHGGNSLFSTAGIQSCVDFFLERGHKEITVFIPSFRKECEKVTDASLLFALEKAGHLVWTPSRRSGAHVKRTVCYDDRYMLKLAVESEGVVVSNDNYRDLVGESAEFRKVVEERVLMYSFVGGRFTPPEDPLGRCGPSLDQFLLKSKSKSAPPCPYGRKCTYGSKCKYYHPFQQKSVSDTLRLKQAANKTQSMPLGRSMNNQEPTHPQSLTRTRSAVEPRGGPIAAITSPIVRPHRKLERQLSINPYELNYLPTFPDNPGLSAVWGPQQQQQNPPSDPEADSGKLRNLLSQIFPQAQVNHVLELYPDCTEPSFICQEIVRIFKK